MRKIVLSLATASLLALATISASAQSWRGNGGHDYQGGNPARANHIANCVDRLPRWGMRNPCPRGGHHAGRGGHHGRHGMHQGHGNGRMGMNNRSSGRATTARSFQITSVRKSSFVVPTGQVRVKTGTMMVNRRTGEQIFIPVSR